MGLVVVERELGQAPDRRGRIEVLDVDALLGTADGAVGAFEHGDEEPFLALEVVVDHPLGRARPRRDLVHARAGEAVGRELAGRHVEDLAARSVRVADRPPLASMSSRHGRRFPCLCCGSSGMNVLVRTLHDKPNMPLTTDTAGARRYTVGLVGAELDASLSPALHEREAAALGLRYVYERLDLATLGLEPADAGMLLGEVQRAGFAGVNVTHPCKQVVVEHLDELSPVARHARRREHGRLRATAGDPVTTPTGRASGAASPTGSRARALDRVVVLGAGGAGTAVAWALLTLGARRLTVVDVEPERAASSRTRSSAHAGAGRIDAAPIDELRGPPARRRRPGPRHPDGHGRPSRAALPARVAAPRAVGGRGRLPPARDRAPARGSRGGMSHPRRRAHGGVPGRRGVRALHRGPRRPPADAAPLRRAGRRGRRSPRAPVAAR